MAVSNGTQRGKTTDNQEVGPDQTLPDPVAIASSLFGFLDRITSPPPNAGPSRSGKHSVIQSTPSPESQNQIPKGLASQTLNTLHHASPSELPDLLAELVQSDNDMQIILGELREMVSATPSPMDTQATGNPVNIVSGTLPMAKVTHHEEMALVALLAFSQSGQDENQILSAHLNAKLLGKSVAEWLALVRTIGVNPGPSSSGVRPTQQMVGRFKLIRLIGKGSFGAVHEAIDTSLGRKVAVKLPLYHNRKNNWEYIRKEARLAAAIDHPNVVPLLEIVEHNGKPFLVSSLVDGVSMKEWLAGKSGSIPPRQAARLAALIGRGVQAIHDRGILHCDLKTGNILLDESSSGKSGHPTPRITDFGLSGWSGDQGSESELGPMGSYETMAPEQLNGRAGLTVRTDVFAVGAILHELLFKENHHRSQDIEVIRNRLESKADPLPVPHPIPPDLESIRKKCLSPQPDARYQSAEDVSADLDLFLEGRAPKAARATSLGKIARLYKRRPFLAISATAAFLAFIMLTAGGIALAFQLEIARGAKRLLELKANFAASRKAYLEHRQALSETRLLLDTPKPGSVAQSLEKIKELLAGNHDTPTSLEGRSLVMQAGLLPRINPAPGRGDQRRYFLSAWSPTTSLLALSQPKGIFGVPSTPIQFFNAIDETAESTLTVPVNTLFQFSKGVQDGVRSMVIDPSGHWLAAGTRSGHIHIFDLNNKKGIPHVQLDCKSGEIGSLAFADGASTIIGKSRDHTLVSIKYKDGNYSLAKTVRLAPLPIEGIAVSQQLRRIILTMNDGSIQSRPLDEPEKIASQGNNLGTSLFTLKNGTVLRRLHNRLDICSFRELPGREGPARLDLKPIVFLRKSKMGSESPPVISCSEHPSGCYIAVLDNTSMVSVYETFSGRLVCAWHEQGEITSLAFSPDGNHLTITGGASRAAMYNFDLPLLATPVDLAPHEVVKAWYLEGQVAPEVALGIRLENDSANKLTSLNETKPKQDSSEIIFLNKYQTAFRMAGEKGGFSLVSPKARSRITDSFLTSIPTEDLRCSMVSPPTPDSPRIVAIGTGKGVIIWDTDHNITTASWTNVAGSVSGRSGTKYLSSMGVDIMALGVDGTFRLFDKELRQIKFWKLGVHSLTHALPLPTASTEVSQAVIGDEAGGITLIDKGQDLPLFSSKGHEGPVNNLAIVHHADSTILMTVGADGRLRLWSIESDHFEPIGEVTIGNDAHVLEEQHGDFILAARNQTAVWRGKTRNFLELLALIPGKGH